MTMEKKGSIRSTLASTPKAAASLVPNDTAASRALHFSTNCINYVILPSSHKCDIDTHIMITLYMHAINFSFIKKNNK